MSLAKRLHQAELMDSLDVDTTAHEHALRALSRLNAISFSSQIVWPTLQDLAKSTPDRPLRVLDLACGGGDIVCRLARGAERNQLKIEFHGIDRSPFAIQLARQTAANQRVNVTFEVGEVLHSELPKTFDVVMCSLFLHHLSECDAVELIRRMRVAARRTLLVNDLRRTRLGFALTWFGCQFLTRSHIVHVDGPRSVEGSFTDQEVVDLASRAGCANPRLTRHWPQRYLLRWDHS